MATIAKENLDERIERIRKRNEEIEKKYREAEEDRLMALKDNAMVEIKPPKDEDWPKGHKYDKIDFTYDVDPEKLEEHNKTLNKTNDEIKPKRDYKKFADGQGPPPDPVYNFLADAERDGTTTSKIDGKEKDKKDPRHIGKLKKDQQQIDAPPQQQKRGGANNSSFRGARGGGGKSHFQKQNSQPEYEQWRNEREKIDEARINRQKVGEGKWRREWDNDKLNSEGEALLKPERSTLADAFHAATNATQKRSPTHGTKPGYQHQNQHQHPHEQHQHQHSQPHQQNQHHHQTQHQHAGHGQLSSDCLIEKRGNITVSVTQTGEVKRVKLTSVPAIGTGRVGPRHVTKPQFSVQTIEKDVVAPAPEPAVTLNNHSGKTNKNKVQLNLGSSKNNQNTIVNNNSKINNNNDNSSTISNNSNVNANFIINNNNSSIQNYKSRQLIETVHTPVVISVAANNLNNHNPIKMKQKSSPQMMVNNQKSPPPAKSPKAQRSLTSKQIVQGKNAATPPNIAHIPVSPVPISANEIIAIDLSHKPEFAKKSVQDRLIRARQKSQTDSPKTISTQNSNTNSSNDISDKDDKTDTVNDAKAIDNSVDTTDAIKNVDSNKKSTANNETELESELKLEHLTNLDENQNSICEQNNSSVNSFVTKNEHVNETDTDKKENKAIETSVETTDKMKNVANNKTELESELKEENSIKLDICENNVDSSMDSFVTKNKDVSETNADEKVNKDLPADSASIYTDDKNNSQDNTSEKPNEVVCESKDATGEKLIEKACETVSIIEEVDKKSNKDAAEEKISEIICETKETTDEKVNEDVKHEKINKDSNSLENLSIDMNEINSKDSIDKNVSKSADANKPCDLDVTSPSTLKTVDKNEDISEDQKLDNCDKPNESILEQSSAGSVTFECN